MRIVHRRLVVLLLALGLAACSRSPNDTPPVGTSGQAVNESLSDGWITTKIQAQYFADPNIKSRRIHVDTNDGVVTISGTIDSAATRQRALDIATKTDGVRRIDDRLTIGREPPDARGTTAADLSTRASNGWITTKIQAQYFLDREVKGRDIDVTTANGTVTLSGHVDSERARQRAVDIARKTDGVRRIEDRLKIGSSQAVGTSGTADTAARSAADAGLTLGIQSKYFLDEEVKGRNIDVDTSDGVVTLNGSVGSEAERRQAVALARSTNGVRNVIDRLKVEMSPTAAQPRGPLAPAVADAWITTKVQSKYFLDPLVKARDINVTTSGVVTLEGTVDNAKAREQALALARDTTGVANVVDRLKVTGS